MTSHTQLWVYNSENRFVGSFYQFTSRVERTKGLEDKTEFWDRLVMIDSHISKTCKKTLLKNVISQHVPQGRIIFLQTENL